MTSRPHQVPYRLLLALVAIPLVALSGPTGLRAQSKDLSVVPASIRDAVLHEYSGENALRTAEILSANRDRQASEYLETLFEAAYLRDRATEYGLSDVKIDYFPSGEIWDGEEADLWMTQPVRRKIASLAWVPAALASGSLSGDVEAEVVYVGAGRDADFQGKDVTGKIVLGNSSVTAIFAAAVNQRGAAGALGTGSAGVSANSPGYTLDQLGWQSVSPRAGGTGFGFVLSLRQFTELRDLIERGTKVVVSAHVKTKSYPYKMNVISAAIPGTDPAAGDLMLVAHAFERIGTPGANDNCSGVATILEGARTLARLIRDGALPKPRRTIRFLWVPEISGSRAFMTKNPALEDTLVAVMNHDMTGADLKETDTYLRMKMTPDSRPSFLNSLIASLLLFVDQTEIRTQYGNNSPFNYRVVPYIGNSDHSVFLDAGIPAMQFNHWPDNFYHSSEDRAVHLDPTELKRVGFMGSAGFYYLATAGSAQAQDLAWEAAADGDKWIAEVTRQSARLLGQDGAALYEQHKAAQTKITGAFNRAKGSVESVTRLAGDPAVTSLVSTLVAGLDGVRQAASRRLESLYQQRAQALGVAPRPVTLTATEQEYDRLVPRRNFKVFAPRAADAPRPTVTPVMPAAQGTGARLAGLAPGEVANFIDGKRSVLEIYQGVRAEYGNVTTSSNDFKFAYVVTPETPDVDLEAVAAQIRSLEAAGTITVTRRSAPVR